MIEQAVLIRRFEELILRLFSEGKLNGTVHTCLGQEWTGIAVCNHLLPRDTIFSNHRGHGHFIARTGNVNGLLAEVMGRSSGVCGGIGGSQHVCQDGFYSNGILGGMVPVAAGNAFSHKLASRNNISVVFSGDGSLGEGIIYETLNLVSKWEIPLLMVVERNGYAQSTNTNQTIAGNFASRATAFEVKHFSSTTWEVDELLDSAGTAVDWVRKEGRPAILEIETYRLAAHSKGDDNRDQNEIDIFRQRDSLTRILATDEEQAKAIETRVQDKLQQALTTAESSDSCSFSGRKNYISKTISWEIPDMQSDRYGNLLYSCFCKIFKEHENAIMIGEDIEGEYGGAFKITRDLSQLYPGRVRNTPISEAAITGVGSGLAMGGFLPFVEIMFGDFLTLTFDQLLQHASKFETMYNGKVKTPLVIRTPMGGRRGYGPTHSQSIEGHFLGIPNLDVLALNLRIEPDLVYRELMNANHSPVLVIENKVLYTRTLRNEPPPGYIFELSDERFPTVRLRPIDVNPDATIVCYGGMLEYAEDALTELFNKHEILCDLICTTQLSPLNILPILQSVQRTRRLVVAEEGKSFAAWGSEVLAQLISSGATLNSVVRLGNDELIPSNFAAEKAILPSTDDIVKAAIQVIKK